MQAGMNQGDNLEEIYAWIDEIPFSRPKKNIPRDFSDGVLMAEVLKAHYPRYIDVHNYIPASSIAAKRDNWNTLNRKVLSKIDMKLSKDLINQLANSQQGVIEKVLIDLRRKIFINHSSFISEKENLMKIQYDETFAKEKTLDSSIRDIGNVEKDQKTDHLINAVVKSSSSNVSVTKSTKNLIGKACGWVVGWIWPFNETKKSTEKELSPDGLNLEKSYSSLKEPVDSAATSTTMTKDEDEIASISCVAFMRLKQEVDEKNLAIRKLNRKVSCLESVMKLKDEKIGNLSAKISAVPASAAPEVLKNLRPHVIGSSISRLRSQSKHKSIS